MYMAETFLRLLYVTFENIHIHWNNKIPSLSTFEAEGKKKRKNSVSNAIDPFLTDDLFKECDAGEVGYGYYPRWQ